MHTPRFSVASSFPQCTNIVVLIHWVLYLVHRHIASFAPNMREDVIF